MGNSQGAPKNTVTPTNGPEAVPLDDCPPGSCRIGDDPICHAVIVAGVNNVPVSLPAPPITTVAERTARANRYDVHMVYGGHASRTLFTPAQVASMQDLELDSCIAACEEARNAGRVRGTCECLDGKIDNLIAAGTVNDPAPPLHEQPISKPQLDYITQMIDASNLKNNIGGDAGASREPWLGPNATVKGMAAHSARIQSGLTRGPTETEKGDHGEPSLQEQRVRNTLDWFPVVGSLSRSEQALQEAADGNVHAWEATSAAATNAAFDVGFMALGPAASAAKQGIRGVGRAGAKAIAKATGRTTTEQLSAVAIAGGLERGGGSVLVDSGLEAANTSAHASAVATSVVGGTTKGAGKLAVTGTEQVARRDAVSASQRAIEDAASKAVTKEAGKLAQKDLLKFTMKDAEKNAVEVVAKESEEVAETVAKHLTKGTMKRAAKGLATQAAISAAGGAVMDSVFGDGGPEHCDYEKAAMELGEDFDTDGVVGSCGDPNKIEELGDDPLLPGEGEEDAPRTSSHTTPHQTQGHNAFAQYQSKLAQRVHPQPPELFGGPVNEPMHPHQVGDMSNTYILGALALGGIFVATRA